MVKKWNEYRYEKKDRTKVGQEFIESYNLELLYKELFQKIGKVAIGTIYNCDKKLRNYDDNWHCLIKNYSFGVKTNKKSGLSEKEEEIFLSILLHPNQIKIGKAIKLTKTILEHRGVKKFSCDMTYRRFINNYKNKHYDTWFFAREGHKALHDKVLPYITRDTSKLEVEDVIIGDGHKFRNYGLRGLFPKIIGPKDSAAVDTIYKTFKKYYLNTNKFSTEIALKLAQNELQNDGKIAFPLVHNAKSFYNKLIKELGKPSIEHLRNTAEFIIPDENKEVVTPSYKVVDITFKEAAANYLKNLSKLKKEERLLSEKTSYKNQIAYYFDDYKINEITPEF